ncbi:ribonuclease PH [candidate division TA06 bacterium]|uniref:Ribonuclease PH n=1 Tax=candidate division TA06 bacterium TaxID=2250710 RepID=A0A660S8D9_UNCT6|nr:MAG: ribonuclease PH [candidate division TA06 bacterium]
MRNDERKDNQLRKISIIPHYIESEEASVLVKFGKTHVLVTATASEGVPPFLKHGGWITAEYGMLPRSSPQRISRERKGVAGRSTEIQRLIGRSLRAACDLEKLNDYTIIIDADVIQADGGTRTASITGGYVALYIKLKQMLKEKKIEDFPIVRQIAAVSAGIKDKKILLDLNYIEDSTTDVDLNLVADSKFSIIEIQGTGEKTTFTVNQLNEMLKVMKRGLAELFEIQRDVLKKYE